MENKTKIQRKGKSKRNTRHLVFITAFSKRTARVPLNKILSEQWHVVRSFAPDSNFVVARTVGVNLFRRNYRNAWLKDWQAVGSG